MHPRLWAIGAASVLAVLAVPAAAQAGVGVGIQAGPVRLSGAAHAGGSYPLPAVYVVNSGTQDESLAIRIERVSPGNGRTVPPSWVRPAGPSVTLSPNQSARIPLELVVPASARPGPYFSDVVVQEGVPNSVGGASFGAGAATDLEFRVAPGSAPGPWFSVPGWVLLAAAVMILLGAAAVLVRRSGLRIRIEREPAGSGSLAGRKRDRPRAMRWLPPVVLIGLAGCGSAAAVPQGASGGASITLTLHTLSDLRETYVSPSAGTFTDCQGGSSVDNTHSKGEYLGYPNGSCSFSWITIRNAGLPANIDILGSGATPSADVAHWSLCSTGRHATVKCTGPHYRPGIDQYLLQNYNAYLNRNRTGITDNLACDHEFSSSGTCSAPAGAKQREGVDLVGPTSSNDPPLIWTVVITWYAVPR
jgi:hypothetical protein